MGRIQSNSGFVSGGTSKAVAFGSNNTAGNVLVAFVFGTTNVGASVKANSVADSQVNTWVSCGADQAVNDLGRLSAWYVQSCKAGANTVTGSNTATGGDIHVHIYEISLNGQASPQLDQRGVNSGATTTLTVTTSGSVAQAAEYVVACFGDWAANRTLSAGSGYTIRQQSNNATTGDCTASEDANTATGLSGTQTATVTGGNAADTYQAYIVTFKDAGASSVFPDSWYQPSNIPLRDRVEVVSY